MFSARAFFRNKNICKGDTITVNKIVFTFGGKEKLKKRAEYMKKFYAKHNIDVKYRSYLDGILLTVMI